MADEMKTTYILQLRDGKERKVTVPNNWTLTFGPLVVGGRQRGEAVPSGSGVGGVALRFYEDGKKENQRACFTDVISFRDASIMIEERVTRTRAQTLYRDTPEGKKQVIVEANVKEWRNPDDNYEPEEEFQRPLLGPVVDRDADGFDAACEGAKDPFPG